jgi:hypothetical protein
MQSTTISKIFSTNSSIKLNKMKIVQFTAALLLFVTQVLVAQPSEIHGCHAEKISKLLALRLATPATLLALANNLSILQMLKKQNGSLIITPLSGVNYAFIDQDSQDRHVGQ